MRFNISCRHAFGVHGQDLLLNVLADAGLILLQQLGFKFTFPIPRHGDLNIPEAGAERLAAVAVPAVVGLFVPVVILAVAQFILQLGVQAFLHEFRDGFLEEALNVLHAGDVTQFQQLPDLCPPGLLFRASVLSTAHSNTSCAVPSFYTAQEVYTIIGIVSGEGAGLMVNVFVPVPSTAM